MHLKIREIKYEGNIQLTNISEYEFELVKVNVILETNEEMEIYLKMIKNSRIKESIFCYWCAIYEEELFKAKEIENMDTFVNKVLISELNQNEYQKRIFLTIENNNTRILATGTEVSFIDIIKYIDEQKNEVNQFEKLNKYIDKESEDVLLVGIKKVEKDCVDFLN